MKIESLFQTKTPVISFELFPPKKESTLKNIDGTLEELSHLNPDFISVTFGAGGSIANNATIELAKKIKTEYQIEPMAHLTCISHTKEDIGEILKQLKENDIQNVLALRGDSNPNI